jgi:hypothetical protein
MSEGLPAALRPPVALALAKAVESIPRADALPGGCLYEPKWDGFRVCMVVGTDGISLWSRRGKDLTRYSVGVKRRLAHLWPGESAVVSARHVSLTCLFSARREPSAGQFPGRPARHDIPFRTWCCGRATAAVGVQAAGLRSARLTSWISPSVTPAAANHGRR